MKDERKAHSNKTLIAMQKCGDSNVRTQGVFKNNGFLPRRLLRNSFLKSTLKHTRYLLHNKQIVTRLVDRHIRINNKCVQFTECQLERRPPKFHNMF